MRLIRRTNQPLPRLAADSDFTHDAVAWVLHPNNPMGVAAMTLSGGAYAIHGTNKPESIGKFASYGCIRMLNDDISDLFGRVDVGTQVVVMR